MRYSLAQVEGAVRDALTAERCDPSLARILGHGSASPPGDAVVQQAAKFLEDYVRLAADTISALVARPGLGDIDLHLLLDSIVEYWMDPWEVFADQHGIAGLIDDAYVTLRILEERSARQQESGLRPLVDAELAQVNRAVAGLFNADDYTLMEKWIRDTQTHPHQISRLGPTSTAEPALNLSEELDLQRMAEAIERLRGAFAQL